MPAMPAKSATVVILAAVLSASCMPRELPQRTFRTAEEAVQALEATIRKGDTADLVPLFGPDAQLLVDTSDPLAARQRREVFLAAMAEGWRLADRPDGQELVIGNEAWPFPVPLAKNAFGWRFDTAAGRREVLARRIGRNELAVIDICRRYVEAQRRYAAAGRDGRPGGIYAQKIRSDPGKQNGLYWPAASGQPRSPLGDLVADAADQRLDGQGAAPIPLHGYYFRIVTRQGPAAEGGARNYIVDGAMSEGFALVAWPARFDITGVMTFVVSQEGIVHEKDLGRRTEAAVAQMTSYDPDSSWPVVP